MEDSGSFGDSWGDLHGDSWFFGACACGVVGCACCDCCVSPSSVGSLGEVSPSDSDCEIVKLQSFSFSRKRQAFHMESQGDMNAASPPEDVQPLSRRRTQEVDCRDNQ